jgi:uncharacterized membrane protein
MDEKKVKKAGWGKTLRGQFMTGLVVIVPVGATVLILVWLFTSIDNILRPLIKTAWGYDLPGVGFGVTVILIYVTGVIAKNVIGKRIVKYFESLLARVPIFRLLYRGIRQILESFSEIDQSSFMQVVLVEFPHKGMKSIAFITNELVDKNGEKSLCVLIPTAPNPTTGFLQILKEEDVIRTDISVDDAIKMVISAGRMMPGEVQNKI